MRLDTIRLNERNPRKISPEQLEKLKESLKRDPEFMELRPIVVDNDGVIMGGNQRYRALVGLGFSDVPDSWVVKADNLAPEQLRRFVLVDNAPEGMSGEWDFELLNEDWAMSELEGLGFDMDAVVVEPSGGGIEIDDTYTRKLTVPVYEPKGERPPIKELIDRQKAQGLIDEIESAGLPDEVSGFLKFAAERHSVFHFRKIAEFYCHATEQVQDLMEKSGLVIIDFGKAIEYGFVHMTEKLGELADLEEADNDDEG
jgi:PAS domain-containing protein